MPISLNSRRYYELVNPVVIQKLITGFTNKEIQIDRWKNLEKFSDDYEKELIKKLKYIRQRIKKGKIAVQYDFIIPDFGRVYEEKSYCSIGQLPREVRATLGQEKYIDIDIANCHPVLLVQLCDKFNIPCDEIRHYVNNRDDCLNRVMDLFACSKESAKNLFIRLMYGGSIDKWKESVSSNIDIPSWLNDFKNCVGDVFSELITKYPEEINKLNQYGKFNKGYNKIGTAASWILQNEECKILDAMLDYIRIFKKGVNNCILCFDGFMMLKDKFTSDLLENLELHVLKQLGYKIKLTVKQFEPIDLSNIKLEEEVDYNCNYYAPETPYYDHDVMVMCSNKLHEAYPTCKEYFERFHAYDRNTDKIVFADIANNRILYKSKETAKTTYGNIFYDSDDSDNKKKFIKSWLDDPNRRDIDFVDETPYSDVFKINRVFSGNMMNSFTGFNKNITRNISDEEIAKGDEWFNSRFFHTLVRLCEGNEEYANWLLCYLAQIIQHPERRYDRAVIICGEQGCGKNSILEAISRVIGEDHYETSSDPTTFFGPHAIGHAHKLLINCDESSAKSSMDFAAKIKTFITTNTIEINEKFVKQYKLTNYARLIATTNTTSALPVDFRTGDRRFVMFEAKRFSINGIEYEYNTPEHSNYFNDFYNVMDSDWFPSYFYKKLMNVDLSGWIYNRAFDTQLKEEMTYISQNTAEAFINDCAPDLAEMFMQSPEVEDPSRYGIEIKKYDFIVRVYGSELYSKYLEYCDSSHLNPVSKIMFYRQLLEYNNRTVFLMKKHGKYGPFFIVKRNKLDYKIDCEF